MRCKLPTISAGGFLKHQEVNKNLDLKKKEFDVRNLLEIIKSVSCCPSNFLKVNSRVMCLYIKSRQK